MATALLAGAVAWLGGCSGGSSGLAGPPPVPVELAELRPTEIEQSTEYIGTLRSSSSTVIHPEVAGHVTRIFVESGDEVRAGTPLLQIDPRRQQASVSSQQAAIERQEATVKLARRELDRAMALFEKGVVSRGELDRAESAYETAAAELESLRAQLRERSVSLQYYQVEAPTPGIVGDIPVRVGMRVDPETELTTIDHTEGLEVLVRIPVERAPELRPGLPLELMSESGEVVERTKVSFVSPRADDATQTVLVKGELSEGVGLRPQQYVRARLVWATTEGLVVPVVAVIRSGTERFVFVAEEQDGGLVARQRSVELGPIVGNDFVVRSGLERSERVVVAGAQKLFDGAPIVAGDAAAAPGEGS